MYGELFARIYERIHGQFAKGVIEWFPRCLARYGLNPRRLIDLACGDGIFAVEMGRLGMLVQGVDSSPFMLSIAKERAHRHSVRVDFSLQRMQDFKATFPAEILTCWYDSLNYLLNIEDIKSTFQSVGAALEPSGTFIFDMNTIYDIVEWGLQDIRIVRETDNLLLVARHGLDHENLIAEDENIVIMKDNGSWHVERDTHRERGYAIGDILRTLEGTGFDIREVFENWDFAPVHNRSRRFFVVSRWNA